MGTAYGIAALACVVRRHGGRLPIARRPARRSRGGAVLARLVVDLVGALARPAAAGAGTAPGGVQLVGNLRPREAGAAVLDDGRVRFLLALAPYGSRLPCF